ncbi:MAG: Sortase (surface protein transpeptidase), partial [uncultured Rubrobacteraceae bacterium]
EEDEGRAHRKGDDGGRGVRGASRGGRRSALLRVRWPGGRVRQHAAQGLGQGHRRGSGEVRQEPAREGGGAGPRPQGGRPGAEDAQAHRPRAGEGPGRARLRRRQGRVRGRHARRDGPREGDGLPVAERDQRVHSRPQGRLPRDEEQPRLLGSGQAGGGGRDPPHRRRRQDLHLQGLRQVRRRPERRPRPAPRAGQERRQPPDLHPPRLLQAPRGPGRIEGDRL